MSKYIDADKLIAETEKRIEEAKSMKPTFDQFWAGQISAFKGVRTIITSLQQEQPKDKQIVIITESHGDANIEWDCRSPDDVTALLKSAESFIADKQVEELRGIGSGPDYNTTEGRFRNAHKFHRDQPQVADASKMEREVDLEKEIIRYQREDMDRDTTVGDVARHFYELGLNARKEK